MKIRNVVIVSAIFLMTTFGITSGVYAATGKKNAADYIPSNQVVTTVNRLFTQEFGRTPNPDESLWWKYRARSDKSTESALLGTMQYFRVNKWTYSSMPQKVTTGKLIDCVFDDNSGMHHEYKSITQSDCSVEQAIWHTVRVPTYTYQPITVPTFTPYVYQPVPLTHILPPLVITTPKPTINYYDGNRCSQYNRSVNPSGCEYGQH
jgi:hypothetical protein